MNTVDRTLTIKNIYEQIGNSLDARLKLADELGIIDMKGEAMWIDCCKNRIKDKFHLIEAMTTSELLSVKIVSSNNWHIKSGEREITIAITVVADDVASLSYEFSFMKKLEFMEKYWMEKFLRKQRGEENGHKED